MAALGSQAHEERLRSLAYAAASGVDSVPLTVEALQQRGSLHHVTFFMDARDRWYPGGAAPHVRATCF